MKRIYNKLVRDNIPEIIKSNNQTAVARILSDEDYKICLENKLREETAEYLESGEAAELADILEVVESLGKLQELTLDDLLKIKTEKQKKNGAFDKRIFLEEVEDNE